MVYCIDCKYCKKVPNKNIGGYYYYKCISPMVAKKEFHPILKEIQETVFCDKYNKNGDCKYFEPKISFWKKLFDIFI